MSMSMKRKMGKLSLSRLDKKFQLLKMLTLIMGVLLIPGTTQAIRNLAVSKVKVKHFHFYQKLANPCGFSRGFVNKDNKERVAADISAFTPSFFQAMSTAINLTWSALEDVEDSVKNETDCQGLFLDSLPETPSFDMMNELQMMTATYKMGISLVSHLHILILDREQVEELNEVPSNDVDGRDDEDFELGLFLFCGTEPKNLPSLVEELKVRLMTILCTLVSGANLEQRSAFRVPLLTLESTNIYRYGNSCSAFQTRDCIVFRGVRKLLENLTSKFQVLMTAADKKNKAALYKVLKSTSKLAIGRMSSHELLDNNI